MNIAVEDLTWEQFKQKFVDNSNQKQQGKHILYRGQAHYDWHLESTLFRFLGKNTKKFCANKYHQLVKQIINNRIVDLKHNVPNESPFCVGLLCGNTETEHENNMQKSFSAMIELRHLGFPSPVLDWTINPLIASFFAFSVGLENDNVAIYRLEKKPLKGGERTNIFAPTIHLLPHTSIISNYSGRHKNQEAAYTLLIYNDKDTYYQRCTNKVYFSLSYDDPALMVSKMFDIKKYVITDSKEKRTTILGELYRKNITFEKLYDKTHVNENTELKDIAIKKILLAN